MKRKFEDSDVDRLKKKRKLQYIVSPGVNFSVKESEDSEHIFGFYCCSEDLVISCTEFNERSNLVFFSKAGQRFGEVNLEHVPNGDDVRSCPYYVGNRKFIVFWEKKPFSRGSGNNTIEPTYGVSYCEYMQNGEGQVGVKELYYAKLNSVQEYQHVAFGAEPICKHFAFYVGNSISVHSIHPNTIQLVQTITMSSKVKMLSLTQNYLAVTLRSGFVSIYSMSTFTRLCRLPLGSLHAVCEASGGRIVTMEELTGRLKLIDVHNKKILFSSGVYDLTIKDTTCRTIGFRRNMFIDGDILIVTGKAAESTRRGYDMYTIKEDCLEDLLSVTILDGGSMQREDEKPISCGIKPYYDYFSKSILECLSLEMYKGPNDLVQIKIDPSRTVPPEDKWVLTEFSMLNTKIRYEVSGVEKAPDLDWYDEEQLEDAPDYIQDLAKRGRNENVRQQSAEDENISIPKGFADLLKMLMGGGGMEQNAQSQGGQANNALKLLQDLKNSFDNSSSSEEQPAKKYPFFDYKDLNIIFACMYNEKNVKLAKENKDPLVKEAFWFIYDHFPGGRSWEASDYLSPLMIEACFHVMECYLDDLDFRGVQVLNNPFCLQNLEYSYHVGMSFLERVHGAAVGSVLTILEGVVEKFPGYKQEFTANVHRLLKKSMGRGEDDASIWFCDICEKLDYLPAAKDVFMCFELGRVYEMLGGPYGKWKISRAYTPKTLPPFEDETFIDEAMVDSVLVDTRVSEELDSLEHGVSDGCDEENLRCPLPCKAKWKPVHPTLDMEINVRVTGFHQDGRVGMQFTIEPLERKDLFATEKFTVPCYELYSEDTTCFNMCRGFLKSSVLIGWRQRGQLIGVAESSFYVSTAQMICEEQELKTAEKEIKEIQENIINGRDKYTKFCDDFDPMKIVRIEDEMKRIGEMNYWGGNHFARYYPLFFAKMMDAIIQFSFNAMWKREMFVDASVAVTITSYEMNPYLGVLFSTNAGRIIPMCDVYPLENTANEVKTVLKDIRSITQKILQISRKWKIESLIADMEDVENGIFGNKRLAY